MSQSFILYEVHCESPGMLYVGITSRSNPNSRLAEHKAGVRAGGAAWTDRHGAQHMTVISRHDSKEAAVAAEMQHTLKLMAEHGLDRACEGRSLDASSPL